ncbi:MAG: hypothetical protein NWQ45_11945 [Congregibacter sp.]|nr:hypothetical protein [Congregibacter sp.]
MDLFLSIIGILALGAFLIAAWVFASAAKRYVTGEELRAETVSRDSDLSPYSQWTDRASNDRRKNPRTNVFPITVDGVLIHADRRSQTDRRRAA